MTKVSARSRMAEAAFVLFAEYGFDETTIEQIVERAGVGRTTFFRTFASKEDVIFPDHDLILGRIRDRLAASNEKTALLAIEDAARLVLQHYLDEGDVARVRYRLTSKVPALRAREIASAQQYRLVFKHYILEWLGEGDDSELRADLMAAAVVTAHNHVLRRWLRGQTSAPLSDFDRAMTEVKSLHSARPNGGDEAIILVRTTKDADQLLPKLLAVLDDHQG